MTNREKGEALKQQYFGIEIEMYDITRKHAAELAALILNGPVEYRTSYHTWFITAPDGRVWKFCRDSSIVAARDEERCEMVTPILTYKDLPLLETILTILVENGAKSDPAHMCGVHIHVNGEGHTAQSIKNLVNLVYSHEAQIYGALNCDDVRISRYCKPIDERFIKRLGRLKKGFTLSNIEDFWYDDSFEMRRDRDTALGMRDSHYNQTRYAMLNLHSFFHGHGTVEFRCFQFQNETSIQFFELKAMVQMALALNSQAKLSIRCIKKRAAKANNTKTMSDWLSRLGFVGPDFKEAKKFWTRCTEKTSAQIGSGLLAA